jgi:hypothetical protein
MINIKISKSLLKVLPLDKLLVPQRSHQKLSVVNLATLVCVDNAF